MTEFKSDDEKREILAALARRYAHLQNKTRDYVADMRKNRPQDR